MFEIANKLTNNFTLQKYIGHHENQPLDKDQTTFNINPPHKPSLV